MRIRVSPRNPSTQLTIFFFVNASVFVVFSGRAEMLRSGRRTEHAPFQFVNLRRSPEEFPILLNQSEIERVLQRLTRVRYVAAGSNGLDKNLTLIKAACFPG